VSPLTGFDQLAHAVRTDVGVRRSHNQDAYAADPAGDPDRFTAHGHLFLVADGMGGHAVGEKASAKAVRDIPHTYHKHAHEGASQALRKAFTEANAGIHAIGQENPEFRGLGTTATALLFRTEGAWVGHVGDSRAYRIRDGLIEQLSFDHSAVWEIARRQQVNPEELQGIRSNVILRSLGPDAFVEVDVEGPHPVRPGDIYLLCSDGLTGQLSDYEIGAVAAALPPAEACEFLVELANLRGGPDNITVIVVRVGGTPDATTVADEPVAKPRRRRSIPWPVTTLAAGIVLAVMALVLTTSNLPGGRQTFVLATAAIGVGLFGLGLHHPRESTPGDDEPAVPVLRVYRTSRCRIERPLLDKLVKAETILAQRLVQVATVEDGQEFQDQRTRAEKALAQGDLPSAFRDHCRAMHVLLRTFNAQRHKEEVFQPVWDKHVGGEPGGGPLREWPKHGFPSPSPQ
jgi:serine/threonine protein phosphatase PrpC